MSPAFTSATAPGVSRRAGAGLAYAAIALPVVLYFSVLATHARNVPTGDDHVSVLPFLCDWQEADALGARLDLLFAQYFSHRIVLTKLVALASSAGFGTLNLVSLQVFGWAAWLTVFLLLALQLRQTVAGRWALLPLALLLMQPQGFTNHLNAMQAVQNLGILACAFVALALMVREDHRAFALGAVLGAIAPWVSVNGLLILPVGAGVSLCTGRRSRALTLAVAGAAAWMLFFFRYTPDAQQFRMTEFLQNVAVMAGAPVAVLRLDHHHAAIAGAGLMLVAALFLGRKRGWRTSPVLLAWLAFVVLSILMAARGRIGWGADYMLQDRYRAYGLLLMALLYALSLQNLPEAWSRRSVLAAIPLTVAFAFVSYLTRWTDIALHTCWAEATALNRSLGVWFPHGNPEGWDSSVQALQRAEQAGVYRLPAPALAGALAEWPRFSAPAAGAAIRTRTPFPGFTDCQVTPAPGTRPDFGIIAGLTPVVIPVARWRARLAEVPRRRSLLGDDFSFLIPTGLWPAPGTTLLACTTTPDGKIAPVWSVRLGSP